MHVSKSIRGISAAGKSKLKVLSKRAWVRDPCAYGMGRACSRTREIEAWWVPDESHTSGGLLLLLSLLLLLLLLLLGLLVSLAVKVRTTRTRTRHRRRCCCSVYALRALGCLVASVHVGARANNY